jgi:hypothetical protein
MPKSGHDSNLLINFILKDKSLTKKEKIEKMFFMLRKDFPKESREDIFEICLKYYEYKLGKKNPDKFYLS